MPGCKTKLENQDADGNGEICFWGRHVFMGYLNMPDKTEESLDESGWLHSGDLGKHDEDNFLYITGRIKGKIVFIWEWKMESHNNVDLKMIFFFCCSLSTLKSEHSSDFS